jgi:hypothetical protein
MHDMHASNELNTVTYNICLTAGTFHIFKLENKHHWSLINFKVQCNKAIVIPSLIQ